MIVLIGMLGVTLKVQMVEASGIIYIRPNGSIDPSTAPTQRDGDVYTLIGNIYESIVVERDNIVVSGAGYKVSGSLVGNGILGKSNVTIKNVEIFHFVVGIDIDHSSNNIMFGNNITNNYRHGARTLVCRGRLDEFKKY